MFYIWMKLQMDIERIGCGMMAIGDEFLSDWERTDWYSEKNQQIITWSDWGRTEFNGAKINKSENY